MTPGFWYPYASAQDAMARIGGFVDHTHGPGCGITWSDGYRVAVLRQPRMVNGQGSYLNVFRRHVAAPKPAPARIAQPTFLQRAENFFTRAMEMEAQAEIANAQAQAAGAQAIAHWAHDDVWEPAHRWLLAHKKTADGLGVAIDVIGVAAAAVFIVTLGPEIGAVAVVTGIVAGIGSLLLLAVDGAVFGSEMLGHKEASEHFENSPFAQWTRIVATVMTLGDLPVGGSRAVVSVGKIGKEIEEGTVAMSRTERAAAAARARVAKIRNPVKHPGPVAKRMRQAKRLATQLERQHHRASQLSRELTRTKYFDVPAAVGATPAGAALISAAARRPARPRLEQRAAAPRRRLPEVSRANGRNAERCKTRNAHQHYW